MKRTVTLRVTVVVFLILQLGCAEINVTGPRIEPGVVNTTDSFVFQAAGLRNVTQTTEYVWRNTGTVANVTQNSSITSGTAILRIRDNSGAQVYSNSLAATGTVATSAGVAGNWTIEVAFTNVTGTVSFTIQRRP